MKDKQSTFSFQIISKYRTVLMGLAILSIIFFHYTEDCVTYEYNLRFLIRTYKQYVGSCGVDVFLFLSGLGVYYSFKKKPDKKIFYKKRFTRVLVPYFIIAIPAWIVKDMLFLHTGVLQVVKDIFFISFFESGYRWFWYILMIICCYLIYPYVFEYIDGPDSIGKMKDIFCVFTILGILFLLGNPDVFDRINILLLRFPAFFLGSFVGKASFEEVEIPRQSFWIVILTFILVSINTTSKPILSRYIFGVFGIVSFCCIAMCLELMSKRNIRVPRLKAIIEWFGDYSLELYLTHVTLRRFMIMSGFPTYKIRYECIMILLSILLSLGLKKLSNFVIQKFN